MGDRGAVVEEMGSLKLMCCWLMSFCPAPREGLYFGFTSMRAEREDLHTSQPVGSATPGTCHVRGQ
jgi:hypothetical protein